MARRPDILLLLLDTQRADRLSCFGYPEPISPHLDRLAAEGALFRHAVTPAQWTIPAHASLFTGTYANQHQMFALDSQLPVGMETLASRLHESGYYTAGLSNNPLVGVLNNGLRRGFKAFANYGGFLTPPAAFANGEARDAATGHYYLEKGLRWLTSRLQSRLAHSNIWKQILAIDPFLSLWQRGLELRGRHKGDTQQTLIDALRLFVDRRGSGDRQPIFAFLNLMGVHWPFDPPRWARERFAKDIAQFWPEGRRRAQIRQLNAQIFQSLGPLQKDFPQEQLRLTEALYNAEVAAQDSQLGWFFDRLRESGKLSQMLVIVTSDHGEHLGEKQLLGHGFGAYEELAHVPLIIRGPESLFDHQIECSSFVSTRRVFHTVLSAAGAATVEEMALSLAVEDQSSTAEEVIFMAAELNPTAVKLVESRAPSTPVGLGYDRPHRAAYFNGKKLIVAGDEILGFFDIHEDPGEENDLLLHEPIEKEKLASSLERYQETLGDEKIGQPKIDDPMVLRRLQKLGYG